MSPEQVREYLETLGDACAAFTEHVVAQEAELASLRTRLGEAERERDMLREGLLRVARKDARTEQGIIANFVLAEAGSAPQTEPREAVRCPTCTRVAFFKCPGCGEEFYDRTQSLAHTAEHGAEPTKGER